MEVVIKTSDGRDRKVYGKETCSPYFAITNSLHGKRFSLTHIPSGCVVARANSHKPLRLLAGIFGALPIPWRNIKSSNQLLIHWCVLPKSIQDWGDKFMRSLEGK